MNTIINIGTISTDVETGVISVTMVDGGTPITTLIQETVDIQMVEVGLQGPVGAQGPVGPKGDVGDTLEFELLTEQQKLELRGDVGNTSTNYTNLFNSVLLS